jgi:hypothetical protein
MDYPGGLISSLAIAIVACNGTQSLEPLESYKRLQELADLKSSASELKHWLETGDSGRGPVPDAERAGRKEDSADVRRDVLLKYISDNVSKYEARFAKQSLSSDRDDSQDKDLTWEIREPLLEALKSLHKDVAKMDFDAGEDED